MADELMFSIRKHWGKHGVITEKKKQFKYQQKRS